MSLLFSSTFGGFSVLWDREFGFLKEIMVAPVSRVSIVLGRIAGGITTALIQGLFILAISFLIGFRLSSLLVLPLGLIFPLFFLSGALYPLENFPVWLRVLSSLDPLTYGIDGLRAIMIGQSSYPVVFNIGIMVAYFFEKSESV